MNNNKKQVGNLSDQTSIVNKICIKSTRTATLKAKKKWDFCPRTNLVSQ